MAGPRSTIRARKKRMNALPRWEQGSEFHWLRANGGETTPLPWREPIVLAGSGRDAIRCLLAHGIARRGWRRIWMPTYFCQDVLSSIASTGITVRAYHDNPLLPAPARPAEVERGDVLYVVNYFGLRSAPPFPESYGAELVEDHTHDPWSHWASNSNADYCIASLRKALPIPDGAVLWSPRERELPPTPAVTPTRQAASAQKLAAMLLKHLYLEGQRVNKQAFRDLARQGESNIASGEVSGISPFSAALLSTFPITSWRNRRRLNQQRLCARLAPAPWATVLSPDGDGSCPFSGIIVFDTAARAQHVRQRLIGLGVYPAVLWSLDNPVLPAIPDADRELWPRLMSVHCDMRYSNDDMDRVAELIVQLGNEWHR